MVILAGGAIHGGGGLGVAATHLRADCAGGPTGTTGPNRRGRLRRTFGEHTVCVGAACVACVGAACAACCPAPPAPPLPDSPAPEAPPFPESFALEHPQKPTAAIATTTAATALLFQPHESRYVQPACLEPAAETALVGAPVTPRWHRLRQLDPEIGCGLSVHIGPESVLRRRRMMLASSRTDVVNPATEARPVLVSGSVFKTDGAPRKRALGGFDSRALPRSQFLRTGFCDRYPAADRVQIATTTVARLLPLTAAALVGLVSNAGLLDRVHTSGLDLRPTTRSSGTSLDIFHRSDQNPPGTVTCPAKYSPEAPRPAKAVGERPPGSSLR